MIKVSKKIWALVMILIGLGILIDKTSATHPSLGNGIGFLFAIIMILLFVRIIHWLAKTFS